MTMLEYDADADALYARISSVDAAGRVVGIEVLNPGRIWPVAAILRRYPDISDEEAATLVGACPFAGGKP